MILESLSRKPFSIIGHRGAAGLARENSLKALEEAVRYRADIAEFDVQVSRDGVVVVSHDETVVTDDGLSINLRDLFSSEIKRLRVGGESIPTLEEIIEHAREKIDLFIEIKNPADSERVIEVIRRARFTENAAIISFHDEAILRAREHGLVTGLIYYKPPGRIVDCAKMKCSIVLPRHPLATERAVELAHRLKLKIVAWTVNDLSTMIELARRGVDGIATDYPNIAYSARERLRGESRQI
ncbi:MAG: glycerophosphodiester phosphodiesterase [Sulfolobales archaeon]